MKPALLVLPLLMFGSIFAHAGGTANNAEVVAPGVINSEANAAASIIIEEQAHAMAVKQQQDQLIQAQHNAFVPRDPWRALHNRTNYIKPTGREFCGQIVEVSSDGVRIQGQFGDLFTTSYDPLLYVQYRDFRVAHYPLKAETGQIVSPDLHLMAWDAGTYTYVTINGSSRTIHQLDYGTPCCIPDNLVILATARQKAQMEQAKIKNFMVQSNAMAWFKKSAESGSPSSQRHLGLCYLNGLGCETNLNLAKEWLKQAENQGDIEASNKWELLNNGPDHANQ